MPTIDSISAALDGAVADGHTVGTVGVVADRSGVVHESAHGVTHLGGDSAMTPDNVFRAFSMTKAVGSLAAMQLVEAGRLDLDTPVADLVGDFGTIQVLDGWDAESPRLRPPATPCTTRHLLTHTSGIVYDVWNAEQTKYLAATDGISTLSGALASLQCFPMTFDPGTRWAYGPSTDWVGRVVEAVTSESVDTYVQREILDPLAMTSSGFELSTVADRAVGVHANTPDGFAGMEMDLPPTPEFYGMGHAMHTTGPDYARFCRMVLGGGELDGNRVASADTIEAMSVNAIGDLRIEPQPTANPALGSDIDLFPGVDKTFTLGFMRNESDIEGMRRAGSLSWAGVMNTHYWIDPTAGVIGVVMMQHLPFVDDAALATYEAFERAVYAAT
ncbi:MAG: serine hydrolase domain-containing protein [Actinomycetota bacterium]